MSATDTENFLTEFITAETDTAEAVTSCRDVERFGRLCLECPLHASSWLCPPIAPEITGRIARYHRMHVCGLKITPAAGCTLEGAELLQHGRLMLEPRLLDIEKELGGRACGLSGRCPYCGGEACARRDGLPCRHPELARPSLEALGFDVTALSSRYLKTEILWEHDGVRPEYFMLVGAVFY